MADIHKITINGETILPATTTEAVIHPQLEATVSDLQTEYNMSHLFPVSGVNNSSQYTLGLAISVLSGKLGPTQKTPGTKISFLGVTGVAEFWACYKTPFDNENSWMSLAVAPKNATPQLLDLGDDDDYEMVILGLEPAPVGEVSRELGVMIGTVPSKKAKVILVVPGDNPEKEILEIITTNPRAMIILGTPLQSRGDRKNKEAAQIRELASDFALPCLDLNIESGVSQILELQEGPWYCDSPDQVPSPEWPEYNWTDKEGNIVAESNLTAEIKSYGRCTYDGTGLTDIGITLVGKYISGNLRKYIH